MLYMGAVSKIGLNIPTNNANGETMRSFFKINIRGISPIERMTTGKTRNGIIFDISYFGKEITSRINARLVSNLILGSILCMKVSL